MNVNFFLKEPNKAKTSIQAIIRYKGNRFKVSTGISVEVNFWDKETHRAKQVREYPDHETINIQLEQLDADIRQLFIASAKNKTIPTSEEIKQLTKHKTTSSAEPETTFLNYFRIYATRMNFKPRTELAYGTTAGVIERYEQHIRQTLQFNDIDIEFYSSFKKWVNATPREEKKDQQPKYYSSNTFGTFIKHIKAVMTAAGPDGENLHQTAAYKNRKFVKETEESDTIYLSKDELQAIEQLQITTETISLDSPDLIKKHVQLKVEALKKARAFFLIGCYTALRISDFSRLEKYHIGDNYIRIKPKKGTRKNDDVIIPIHPVIDRILKSGFDISNKMSDQRFNEHIKELCRLAGINEQITVVRTEGGRQISRTVEKWKLVASHTARRSGATNMFIAGIPSISIMKITGHKTEKSFMKYIRITQEENARLLADHPFFKS